MDKIQFAQTIKQKYPQYKDVDDSQLADMVISKYPQYQSRLNETTQEAPQGEKGLGGVATGFTKGVLNTSRNIAGGLQDVGQRFIAGIDPTRTYEDIKGTTGIKSISNTTQEGMGVRDILTAKGTAEKVGEGIEQVAEFFVPASKVSKATALSGRATKIGGQVLSDSAVMASQGGDLKDIGTQALFTGALSTLPLVGKLVKTKLVKPTAQMAENLEAINLRLSPPQKLALKKSENNIVKFLSKNKITGTPEQRYEKISGLVDFYEDKVQKAITESGKKYTKEEIINSVKNIPEEFLSQIDSPQVYNQMQRDVDAFVDFIQRQSGDTIDASRVNQFKRNYAKEARNKLGDVVINDSREALSDGLYNILQKDIKNLKPINKEYGQVLSSERLLGKALGRNELGLVGNLIGIATGSTVGGAVGGPVGAGIGAVSGTHFGKLIAGTKTRSNVGAGLQNLSSYLEKAQQTPAGDFVIPKSILNGLFSD